MIDINKLQLSFNTMPSGKILCHLFVLQIAVITYSSTCKSWFINFKNISAEVHEYDSLDECKEAAKIISANFLNECVNNE